MRNRVARLASKKRYRERHRERLRAESLQRYYNNRDARLAYSREYVRNHPEQARENGRRHDAKSHRKLPRGDYKARQARYRARNIERVRAGRVASETRRRQNPVQRVLDAIRRRIRHVVNGRSKGTFTLFGYTTEELRQHLEAQFQPGMTWDNYGHRGQKWHVDHIKPVGMFDLPRELTECFALANLRPLWAIDNLSRPKRVH